MVDYKVLAQPSAIQTGDTRDNVYYPQIVNLSTLNTRGLIQAMMNMGSTAFSMGEYLGVASDLGAAIAQMLITGHKINLEGLGMFTPKVETTQKNIKEASSINSSNFSCTVVFTPAPEFISILNSVVWNRVQTVDPGQSSSNAFTVAISNPTGNTLKFVASKTGALANFPAIASEKIIIDGTQVANANIRYDSASGAVYVYNVVAGKHTVRMQVGSSRGFDAYDHTWENVAVAAAANQLKCNLLSEMTPTEGWAKIEGKTAELNDSSDEDFYTIADEVFALQIHNSTNADIVPFINIQSYDESPIEGGKYKNIYWQHLGESGWHNVPVSGLTYTDGVPATGTVILSFKTSEALGIDVYIPE